MKKLLLLIAIFFLFVSCENEEQTNCNCNGKWFIPRSEQRVVAPPELELPYQYLDTEIDCETLQPITTPTPNAVFLGCQ